MNALDKAFIRAYSKGTAGAAAPAVVEQSEAGAERAAAACQNRASAEVSRLSPLVEVFAADGVWYRIEQPSQPAGRAPAPHAPFPTRPRQPAMPEAASAAVESNISAAAVLDSLLGLDATVGEETVRAEPTTAYSRVDARHVAAAHSAPMRSPAPQPAPATSERAVLEPHELRAFIQGADASVVAQVWETCDASEVAPEGLCQCFLATEEFAAPLVIEQTWIEVRPSGPPAPAAETKATESAKASAPQPTEIAQQSARSVQTPPRHEPTLDATAPVTAPTPSSPEALSAKSETVTAKAPVAEQPVVAPSVADAVKEIPREAAHRPKPNLEANPNPPAAKTHPPSKPSKPREEPKPAAPSAKPGAKPPVNSGPKAPSTAPAPQAAATSTPPRVSIEPSVSIDTTSKPETPAAPFHAAWEVDRLTWPEECDRLARGDAFGPLAKTLIETSRRGKKVIAVTGLGRGEGRTTLALCLARRAAKEGANVAVLDADFERPHLGMRVGIDIENGWDDVLTDGQPLTEAAVSSLEENLTVIPLGRRAAAVESAHTVAVLRQAAEAFDLVLVDMGPVSDEEPTEPPAGGTSPVAALVVADRRHATDENLARAVDHLEAAGVESLGVVETFA